jgi:hypothetical protein
MKIKHFKKSITMNLLRVYCCISLLILIAGSLHAQGIINGDFESGRNNGWTEYSQGGYTLIGTAALFASSDITPPVTPHSGQFMGRIGGFSYEVNSLSQTVTLPNTTPLYLGLFVQDRNSTTSECGGLWVGAQIRVYVAGQKLYDTYLCYYNQLQAWTPVYFDLTAVAGQTIQIIFQADAANSVWSFLYIDDVCLTNQMNGVEQEKSPLPKNFELSQNFPNPFNSTTTIPFSLAEGSFVSLSIMDPLGRQVASVLSQNLGAGTFNATWDATGFPGGIYVVSLQAGSLAATKKVVLVK